MRTTIYILLTLLILTVACSRKVTTYTASNLTHTADSDSVSRLIRSLAHERSLEKESQSACTTSTRTLTLSPSGDTVREDRVTLIERVSVSSRDNHHLRLLLDSLRSSRSKVDSVDTATRTASHPPEIKLVQTNVIHWWQKLLIYIGAISLFAGLFMITHKIKERYKK